MEALERHDPINPAHYKTDAGIEAIEVIERYGLVGSFHLANAFKYIARAPRKGAYKQDLEKAHWYLKRFKVWHESTPGAAWPAADDVEAAEAWANPEVIVAAFGLTGHLSLAVGDLLSLCLYEGDEDMVLVSAIESVEQAILEAP